VRADDVSWGILGDGDVDDLTALAARCQAADGGLPLTAEPAFVRRRWTADGSTVRLGRDAGGRLVAAAGVRISGDTATVATLVDPAARAGDHAAELLDWGLRDAAGRAGTTVVETEALTPEQAAEQIAATGAPVAGISALTCQATDAAALARSLRRRGLRVILGGAHFGDLAEDGLAVADGLASTARVITAAAAVMVFVFLSFVLGDSRDLKLFGLGLAVAVLAVGNVTWKTPPT